MQRGKAYKQYQHDYYVSKRDERQKQQAVWHAASIVRLCAKYLPSMESATAEVAKYLLTSCKFKKNEVKSK